MRNIYRILALAAVFAALLCRAALGDTGGACGEGASWTLDGAGRLVITGTGEICDGGWDKTAVKTLEVKSGVTGIGDYAFYGCENLQTAVLADSVTRVGLSAFNSCGALTEIDMPAHMTEIGDYAFSLCRSLREIVIPDGVASVGISAFFQCESLVSVSVPDSVTSIADTAFFACGALPAVYLPDGVSIIGRNAFKACPATLYASVGSPTAMALGYQDYNFRVPGTQYDLFYNPYHYMTTDKQRTPTYLAIAHVDPDAELLIVPEYVDCFKRDALVDCRSPLTIRLSEHIFTASLLYWEPKGITEALKKCTCPVRIIIEEGTKCIGSFAGSASVVSVWLPDSVTEIERMTFADCTSLVSVRLPAGLTAMPDYLFSNCVSLREFNMPQHLTFIGYGAFYNCASLQELHFPATVETVSNLGVSTDVILYADRESSTAKALSRNYSFREPGKDYSLRYVKQGQMGLQLELTQIAPEYISFTVPDYVTRIGENAFSGHMNLSSVVLHGGVYEIAPYAFKNCTNLAVVELSEGLLGIHNQAFSGCVSLRGITLPASTQNINNQAFVGCGESFRIAFQGMRCNINGKLFDDSQSPVVYCPEYSDADFWAQDQGYEMHYTGSAGDAAYLAFLPETARMELGSTVTLPLPGGAASRMDWRSADPAIATVSGGVITARGTGVTIVTASVDGVSANVYVDVFIPLRSFSVPDEVWIVSKETMTFPVFDLQPSNATTYFYWASSDGMVLDVDANGVLTARKPGDATLTILDVRGAKRTSLIHVCYPIASIAFTDESVELPVSLKKRLTVTVLTWDGTYENKLVDFSSSDESVLTVDADGVVCGVAPGEATVTAATRSGLTASVRVRVTDPAYMRRALRLPAGLKAVGEEAFAGLPCTAVILPEGCRSIGSRAFADCPALAYVFIPASVTEIAEDAFAGDPLLVIDRE